tara:strand:- start:616 stop:771 length:156 start_codon:yes stop_codon:yes gene_type:complete
MNRKTNKPSKLKDRARKDVKNIRLCITNKLTTQKLITKEIFPNQKFLIKFI